MELVTTAPLSTTHSHSLYPSTHNPHKTGRFVLFDVQEQPVIGAAAAAAFLFPPRRLLLYYE